MFEFEKAIVEAHMAQLEAGITILTDELDRLTSLLESYIEGSKEELEDSKTRQELLEDELEELLNKHCISANFLNEGNMTIVAAIVEGLPYPMIGVAKCCPTDEYNEIEGDIVALRRALNLPVDPAQYGEPKHDCYNCNHMDLDSTEYPCDTCSMSATDDPDLWEPVQDEDAEDEIVPITYDGPLDHDHDCDTCKHNEHTSITQQPCKRCLEFGSRPVCWEPIVKRCSTCKYTSLFILEEPCYECASDVEHRKMNWTPQV
jgi:hypothetical protein